jgi:N-acetyl-gamma-glutamyl-phosphate reductase
VVENDMKANVNANVSVGILGATGYTGRELVRILGNHPGIRIDFLGTSSSQGKKYFAIYPELYGSAVGDVTLEDEHNVPHLDVLFCALPHGIMAERAADFLARGIRVIDLGPDFRLKNPDEYEQWYKKIHPGQDILPQAVYGLSEIYREKIVACSLLANPGCYSTAAILPLAALIRYGLIEQDPIIIDAKSGVSGAGRTVASHLHFCEVDGSFKAYGVEGHRHKPEIEQELSVAAGSPVCVSFTPHLVPMVRGMLATIYVRTRAGVDEEDMRRCWEDAYGRDAFVRLLPPGLWPLSKYACGNNDIYMQVTVDRRTRTATIVSVIDNLVKGASGQAVQNMNIMCGLPETQGLESIGLWP